MIDKLINRTSVRHYLDKPIKQDKIDNLKKSYQ